MKNLLSILVTVFVCGKCLGGTTIVGGPTISGSGSGGLTSNEVYQIVASYGGGGGAAVSNVTGLLLTGNTLYTNNTAYFAEVSVPINLNNTVAGLAATVTLYVDTNQSGTMDYSYQVASVNNTAPNVVTLGTVMKGWIPPYASFALTNGPNGSYGYMGSFSSIAYFATNSGSSSGDVTQYGLAAGSYAINGALATNLSELRPMFVALNGRTFSGLKALNNTNVAGQLSTFTWTTASPGGASLMVTNAAITDAYLTNSATASDHVVLRATNAGYVFLKNVSVIGQNRAAYLQDDSRFILSVDQTTFRAPTAFEAWRAIGSISASIFDSRTTAALASSDVAFLANDDCFLTIQGCEFFYGGSPEGYGYGGMARSKTVFSGCLFSCKSTATNAAALSLFEESATVELNNCLFLAASNFVLTFNDGGVQRAGVSATFNNCFIGDYTTGIGTRLFANSNYVVKVSGGNLVREMFTTQSNVIFEAGDVQINTNAFAIGTIYTNKAAATFGTVAWLGTTTLGGDIVQVDLLIDQDGDATWDSNISRLLYSGTADQNGTLEFNFSLQPSARFLFSTSNSVGATVEFISSQFYSR